MKRNIGNILKKGMALTLSITMMAGVCHVSTHAESNHAMKKKAVTSYKKKISKIKIQKGKEDLDSINEKLVNRLVDVSEKSGKMGAALLETIDSQSDTYRIATEEILNQYYGADSENGDNTQEVQLEQFKETVVNEQVLEKIEDYEEAKAEREDENLDYAAGEVLVTFDKDVEESEIAKLAEHAGVGYEIILDDEFEIDESLPERKKERLKALEDYECDTIVKMDLGLNQTVAGAMEELEEYEGVVNTGENGVVFGSDAGENIEGISTSDIYCSEQKVNLDKINLQVAWKSYESGIACDIWVAVIDSGIRMTHEDLQGRMLENYSVDVTQTENGVYKKLIDLKKPFNDNHGTRVAGVIAAKTDNKIGVVGAGSTPDNMGCRIMGIKASSNDEQGKFRYTDADIANGINYAVNKGAEVINMSLSNPSDIDLFRVAVERAEKAGVVVVAAAGNYSNNLKRYPAAYDTVIGVGGDDAYGNHRYTSTTYGAWVDIIAPATGFRTTGSGKDNAYPSGICGTSFATPLVASTVALMLATNYDLTPKQVRDILSSKANSIDSKYFDCGALNAGLAVQYSKYKIFVDSNIILTSVTAKSGNKITIKWSEEELYGHEKVHSYRSASKNGTYSRIATIDWSDVAYYTDKNLVAGKTYYYKVRCSMAYDDGRRYSDYSEVKSAKAKN